MKQYQGIGMMSGTSLDGLDLVCCNFTEEGETYQFEIIASESVPFDDKWQARLQHLMEQSAEIYAKTDVYFGHWLGQQAKAFIQKHQLKPDFVASHGQTIFHQPNKSFTGQIGDGETLVSYLACPLVSNFRNKDVALKGEGAPLVPLGEKYLFPADHIYLNLGGFANMTLGEIAFDVCPCNIILNHLVKEYTESMEYDEGGELSASGTLNEELLSALNSLPYYRKSHPKTLGWEWVIENIIPILRRIEMPFTNALHTLTMHIAEQIGQAIVALKAQGKPMFITGGGRHNSFLIEKIAEVAIPLDLHFDATLSDQMIDFKEAIIFAFLGLRVLTGKSSTLSSVTGASLAAPCGAIHLPPKGNYRLI